MLVKIWFFLDMVLWSLYIVLGSYKIYKRDFCGPGITKPSPAADTEIAVNREDMTVIQVKPETEKEKQVRLKHELQVDAARTTIEQLTPIIQTLNAEKETIKNDLAIVSPGTRKQTQLLNRLYTIETRIYAQTVKLEKAAHILENE